MIHTAIFLSHLLEVSDKPVENDDLNHNDVLMSTLHLRDRNTIPSV